MVDTAQNVATAAPHPPAEKPRRKMDKSLALKEREFYRYYSHDPKTEGTTSRLPSPTPPSEPAQLPSFIPPDPVNHVPRPSEDRSLTAFAQLGALRLNTRRCLISFFDRRDCYLLAEATRTLCLETGEVELEADRLCWGSTIFPKEKSICYYTVNLSPKYVGPTADHYNNVPFLVVNDLREDARFKDYPFVTGPPYSRFYAGVPIRSPSGHSIGTYCVLDDNPRAGISNQQLKFLKNMANTVMQYLEMKRAAEDSRRGKIMVKSLGSYAGGKGGIESWWQDPWDSDQPPSTSHSENVSTQRRPSGSPLNVVQESIVLNRYDSLESSNPSRTNSSIAVPSSGQPTRTTSYGSLETSRPDMASKTASTRSDPNDRVAPEIRAAFSRAATMILNSTEVDSAAFFDAKISTFGGLVDDDFVSEQSPEADKPCLLLGECHNQKNLGTGSSSEPESTLSESTLRHLLRSYPHGQIFNFDDDDDDSMPAVNSPSGGGEIEFSDGFPFTVSRKSESARSLDDENFLKNVFPKARSLVLYPLWDTLRDRWFACAIIWSSDPMRILTYEQELSYLAAFSNSVMAEIARLDTKLADAAKADFISSISHELRSPLHGILGMTDLLKDSSLDNQQTSHLTTVETCGKTLLDTINHVLDFAKINNLTRGASKRQKKRMPNGKPIINPGESHPNDIMTINEDIDLSILAEDVIETVFAGFTYAKTSAPSDESYSSQPKLPPISLILDINHSANYVFQTQPGAWRRVVMNLFGNSLKYTPAGYIKVKLDVKRRASSADGCCEFRFTITDTGVGMSQEYITTRLFHSFAQENPLSQGTGLGLSIVKQIVESLGGDIEVQSIKDRGTKFTISCPLKESSISPALCVRGPEQSQRAQMQETCKRTKGMTVRLLGFNDEGECLVEGLNNKTVARLSRKAIESMFMEWFEMERWVGGQDAKEPDLVIATEIRAKDLRAQHSRDPHRASRAPVIVLCQGAASAQSTTAITVPGIIFECISQPIGPHKMARALSSCLDRHSNRLTVNTVDTDTSLPPTMPLNWKENAPLHSPTMARVVEASRPTLPSASSAPEIRSVGSRPIKKSIYSKPSRALNCLCVDDNPINLRLLRTFVNKLGHRHVLARDGLEALNQYKAAHPSSTSIDEATRIDVVLMDINMPQMDGLESTRQIRAHEIRNTLPKATIIALTGVADSYIQQEAKSSGVNLFLIKPVRLADLEVILRGVVTGQDKANLDLEEEKRRLRIDSLDGGNDGADTTNGIDAAMQQVEKAEHESSQAT